MTKGIKPGQIPDWRPGAVFWKPLADGREVTIYPLLGGKARLCVGPLAHPSGYDVAYRYTTIKAAMDAAKEWDSENDDEPPGFEDIDFEPEKQHQKPAAPIHSEAMQVGAKIEINHTLLRTMSVNERRGERDMRIYQITGTTEDGRMIEVEAIRYTGDPQGPTGKPMATVTNVSVTMSAEPKG